MPRETVAHLWHTMEDVKVVLGKEGVRGIIPFVNQMTQLEQGARGGGRTRTPCGART